MRSGIGPKVLKYGNIGEGKALLISPLFGKMLPGRLPPPSNVLSFLPKLHTGEFVFVENHPRIKELLNHNEPEIRSLIDGLSKQKWEIVAEHGDFAPWNLILNENEFLSAIDWEYGCLQGFPHLDLIYYFLQVGVLIYRWHPEKTISVIKNFLEKTISPALNRREIRSLIGLAALAAYHQRKKDGHPDDDSIQVWRHKIINQVMNEKS